MNRTGGGLDPIETASRDEIAALQLERLRASLRHAYENVPWYRRSFDEAGAHPGDVRELANLAAFPFLTKAAFRETYPFGLFAVPRERIARLHASSGTTGKATVVGYTARDIEMWASVVARSIYAAGGRPGDIVHVSYGYGLFTGGLGAHYGAERLGCTVVPMSGGQTAKQVQIIADFRPAVIMVTPSYMLVLLDEMERCGLEAANNGLRTGIFGAEPWTAEMRERIEARAGIDAVDIYGLSEIIGPGVAQECAETKDGLTIWEDHFYPEIIDPISGRVLPDGEYGELVLTTLTKEAQPAIRYRTRDLTRLLPGTARSMRRIERISGRSDDMFIIRGVNVFPTQIEELVMRDARLAPHYRIVLRRNGDRDEVIVRVALAGESSVPESGDNDDPVRALRDSIKTFVGLTVAVEAVPVAEIIAAEGKAKRVFDERAAR